MTLRPVLMPVPGGDDLPRKERMPVQRESSRRAVDESARLCGIEPLEWLRAANGAPAPTDGVHWSLTHKPAWTAGVVSDQPIGIDIEQIAPRRHDYVFKRVAKPDEWELIGQRGWPNFFRLWTAKEATLKANSCGIGHLGECRLVEVVDDTHLITTFGDTDWLIEHFHHDGHLAAVTAGTRPVVWTVASPPEHA